MMIQKLRKRIYQLGLWPRMAMGISLGFLVLFGAFSFLGEGALRESTNRLRDERLGFAKMAASNLDRLFGQAINELFLAQTLADFDPAGRDMSAEQLVLDHTLSQVGFFTLGGAFLDQNARVILSTVPDVMTPGEDMVGTPYFSQALSQQTPFISEPFVFSGASEPAVIITTPVVRDGETISYLSGVLGLLDEGIVGILDETAGFAQTGHSLIVNQAGQVVISSSFLPFLSPGDHVDFYIEALQKHESKVAVVEVDSKNENHVGPHLMAIAPLERVPWGVAIGGSAEEIFAGIRRLRLGLVILGGIMLATTWGFTLVGTRLLVRPVQRMTNAAQQIANGKLDASLETPEGGEIGLLAEALEFMRKQLLEDIEELAFSKENLETQVINRTAALRQQQALAKQLLRRAIRAQEDERARIARELHDETGQTLTAIQINIDRLRGKLNEDPNIILEQLERIQTLTEYTVNGLRQIIADLRPGVLDQLGLVPALKWVAEYSLHPLDIKVHLETAGQITRLSTEIETVLFRIAQEAMSNVAQHSHAKNFTIRIQTDEEQLTMQLQDDGRGFNPLNVASDPEFKHGLGLASMQERASLVSGRVTVESGPRQGTTIHVTVPLVKEQD